MPARTWRISSSARRSSTRSRGAAPSPAAVSCRRRSCEALAAALLLGAAAHGAAARASAQTPDRDCADARITALTPSELGAWGGWRPRDVVARLAPLRRAGRWSATVDSLRAIYLVDRATSPDPGPPSSLDSLSAAERDALRAELDSLGAELRAGERDPAVRARGLVTVRRFDVTPRPPAFDAYDLFVGRGVARVRLDDRVPSDTRRSVCWLAIAAKQVATLFGDTARARVERALAERVTRWDNFMRHGYSMLPLELFVNGKVPRHTLEPPRTQVVLLHPSAGAEMAADRFRSLREFRRVDVLAVEPLGILRYDGAFARYAGLSAVVTFPTSATVGGGLMLHYSPVGRLGYVWRSHDAKGGRGGVLLSLDAYRYLGGVADMWKQLRAEAASGATP